MTSNLKNRIVILAFINFILMPLIFFWQLLYCFFNYADLIKREPGSLGVRKWSQYGKLYLRHLNELDHEFKSRLNRAYKPANQYMEIFVSPMRFVTIYITFCKFLITLCYFPFQCRYRPILCIPIWKYIGSVHFVVCMGRGCEYLIFISEKESFKKFLR